MTPLVSMFPNVWAKEPDRDRPLGEILEDIRAGVYRAEVQRLRAISDPDVYREEKKKLPAFSMSGTTPGRKKETARSHSGFLQVDLDQLSGADIEDLRDRLRQDPYVGFGFVSPSGHGLKLGLRIDGDRHDESFAAAEKYFAVTYQAAIDPAVKDRLRLCFVSWDPELWIADDPKTLPLDWTEQDGANRSSLVGLTPVCPALSKSIDLPLSCSVQTIADAVAYAIPNGPRRNNVAVFRLARALKCLPGLSLRDLSTAFDQWFDKARALGFTRHDRSVYFAEFMTAHKNAKHALIDSPLVIAWERVKTEPLPPAAELFPEKMRPAVALCYQLHLQGQGTFFLACRDLARLLEIPRTTAAAWLSGFVGLKLLEVAEPGTTYRATRYRWKGE